MLVADCDCQYLNIDFSYADVRITKNHQKFQIWMSGKNNYLFSLFYPVY